MTWIGPREASVTLYEFFDYNCPWCRAAARDLDDLVKANPDLRIGLLNNPIQSVQSAQAAKVALAVQRAGGSAATAKLYAALLGPGTSGRIDGRGRSTPRPASATTARRLSRLRIRTRCVRP